MSYTLPSLNTLTSQTADRVRRVDTTTPYTVTQEQASKILNHTGAIREAETELYKALHHFNSLTLAEQDTLDEMAFHDYWVVYLSKGIVSVEPMYEAHHGLPSSTVYKCLDRSTTVIRETHTAL